MENTMSNSRSLINRRKTLLTFGHVTAALATIGIGRSALAKPLAANDLAASKSPGEQSKGALRELGNRLLAAPRRRDFKSVPFIVTNPNDWDHEAALEVLSYKYKSIQAWDNANLASPWLGLMREAMNGQMFAHGNAEFLAVSATHGAAHFALFSQAIWDKYKIPELLDRKFPSNSFIVEREGASPSDDLQNISGFYGPLNSNIRSLQRRGAVFLACHDSIHAIARKLAGEASFSATPVNEIAADLTNNLIPGAILVPSVVAFLVELQRAGFTYVNGG
jgi:intracellular sulfur oxidation DsrE/DsrF family protein